MFKKYCAWCKRLLSEDENSGGDIESNFISHGSCNDCAEKLLENYFESQGYTKNSINLKLNSLRDKLQKYELV